MQESFRSIVDSAKTLLVLLPKRPFFDQVAAGLALYLSLGSKKSVEVVCPDDMTVEFNRLVGVNKVKKELGSKNLTFRFENYPADNIERVSYDIEDGQFRLTVIPKSQFEAPKKEQINFSYSGLSADTVILVGGANETHFPALSSNELKGAKLVHIGNRELSTSDGNGIMSLARPAVATSEIVATLLKETGEKVDQDIATNLLMGIDDESDKLTNSEVTADTFELVAYLMRQGGRRNEAPKNESFPPGAVPGEMDVKKSEEAPKEWMEPKIYKGDTVS